MSSFTIIHNAAVRSLHGVYYTAIQLLNFPCFLLVRDYDIFLTILWELLLLLLLFFVCEEDQP